VKEDIIFDSVGSSFLGGIIDSGEIPGSGTYFCVHCGGQLSLRETDLLPSCPSCGGANFRRDSIFEAHQDHGGSTTEMEVPTDPGPPQWLETIRASVGGSDRHLAYCRDDGTLATFRIDRGWTRIGRSSAADLRLDDPSVSRRHALVVAEPGKELRVLDDRSLNGVFVNGHAIEWCALRDGDELAIGRYKLYALTP
jgi:predicted  nucleic acid-binding Zn-ribbon protein